MDHRDFALECRGEQTIHERQSRPEDRRLLGIGGMLRESSQHRGFYGHRCCFGLPQDLFCLAAALILIIDQLE